MGSRGNGDGCGWEMADDNGSFPAIILHMNSVNGEDKNGLLYRTRTKERNGRGALEFRLWKTY